MKIKKYKLQKVLIEEVDFRIPTETLYLFEYHIRRTIKVIPVYTSYHVVLNDKPEELDQIVFVEVLDGFNHTPTIKKHTVSISDLEDIISKADYKDERFQLLDFLNTYTEVNIRTKEQFEGDFHNVLDTFI